MPTFTPYYIYSHHTPYAQPQNQTITIAARYKKFPQQRWAVSGFGVQSAQAQESALLKNKEPASRGPTVHNLLAQSSRLPQQTLTDNVGLDYSITAHQPPLRASSMLNVVELSTSP